MSGEEITFWGFGEPGMFDQDKKSQIIGPPDPEMSRLMQAGDDYKILGPSSWDLLSPASRRAAQAELAAEQARSQRLPSVVPFSEARDPATGAFYKDIRVYTRTETGEYKFWGVLEDGTTMEEFWAKHDPGNQRKQNQTGEDAGDLYTNLSTGSHQRLSSNGRPAAKSPRRQKTPEINPNHQVIKSIGKSSLAKKNNTRKHLASKVTAGNQKITIEARDLQGNTYTSRNPVQSKAAPESSLPQKMQNIEGISKSASSGSSRTLNAPRALRQKRDVAIGKSQRAADDVQDVEDSTQSLHSRRSQRRTPAKTKPTKGRPKKQKPSVIKGDSRVTKSRKSTKQLVIPSSHSMRTRARGPAEALQLT
ncbi:hypothetical protein MMC28_000079 [Mycoblastus sanguinarius]|nr:hypothetical protein [Mycoblastus sanguinarius]